MNPVIRHLARGTMALSLLLGLVPVRAAPPVQVAISAEYGLKGSETAQSIEKGVRLALEEINGSGGVLGGRTLELIQRDDRGVPARAVDNLLELAAKPDVVAVFCGRFSPVALELAPVANRERILLLDPWAAADGIANNGARPNYVFRLSLTDTWAMEAMLDHALQRGLDKVSLLVPNTGWGRSSLAALEAYARRHPKLRHEVHWYNWGDTDFGDKLLKARSWGMKAVVLVANEAEGVPIVRQMAALPAASRVPVIAHWGITGGNFARLAGESLASVDLVIVQTFSFAGPRNPRAAAVAERYARSFGGSVDDLLAQVGFAHAYDLTHLLARAIDKAGSSDRTAVRAALEALPPYDGLVRRYSRPFTAENHEALDRRQVFLARFAANGTLVPVK